MHIRALKTTGFIIAITIGFLSLSQHSALGQFPSVPGINPSNMVGHASYLVPDQPYPGPMAYPGVPFGGVMQAGYEGYAQYPGAVQQVACFSPTGRGCSGGPGGLLGEIQQGGSASCLCMFCRGEGCSLCKSIENAPSSLGNMCSCLAPYTDAGLCAQRWFDLQAEVMFLSYNGSGRDQVVTNRGMGILNMPPTNPVLSTSDAEFDGLSPGFRVTASFMFGAASNIEAIYFGTHHFSESAEVSGVNDLFSVFTQFGTQPNGGFPDTDATSRHRVRTVSDIHSGEANFRRRWVGPYCRFQGSWLVGFRYFDLDEVLRYESIGPATDAMIPVDPRFFRSDTATRNALVGAQIGGDLWWNVYPGVNLGVSLKGGAFGNRAEQTTILTANALPNAIIEEVAGNNTALMGEIQARAVYRLSYSWSATAAYWLMGVDGVALAPGNFNTNQINLLAPGARTIEVNIHDSITLHGFSLGAEYLW